MAHVRDPDLIPGFRHQEHDRILVFGPGALESAQDLLPDRFTLLTTARAASGQSSLVRRAAAVVYVPSGAVDALAAELRSQATGRPLVALGGGRVIDVAKAIAAAEGIHDVIAIPTSLSGAEMTGVHRQARGVADVPRVRPTLVINDPALSASQPSAQLAAGSANALAHAMTAVLSVRSDPLAWSVGLDAIRRVGEAWTPSQTDRDGLALGGLLAGWSVDLSGLGPHHALAQTAVRTASLEHGEANAVLLPHTVRAFRTRAPDHLAIIDRNLGGPLEDFAHALLIRAGVTGLGDMDGDEELLDRAVTMAAGRPELERIPPPLDAGEIESIYRAAAPGVSPTWGENG
jgi:maleylacetate reductase